MSDYGELENAQAATGDSDEIRRSQRNINKAKIEKFQTRIETQSQYHTSVLAEIQSRSISTNYKLLSSKKSELEKSILTLHDEYKALQETSTISKTTGIEIDRLTHDNKQIQNKIDELMNQLSARPRHEPEPPESIRSGTSKTSMSSGSSNSSKLRRKAYEARATEEAKRAELQMLAIQEEQEAELAELKLQQARELAKKQREIQRTKLQSEITAEKARREVLEQAARDEESGVSSLMRQPTMRAPLVTSMNPRVELDAQVKDKVPTSKTPAKLPEARKTLNLSDQEVEHIANKIHPTHHNDKNSDNRLQEKRATSRSQRQLPLVPEQTSLAGAILEAINYANEYPKLETPKPFIYTGKLTDYPDWRASVNRFVLDRKGRSEDKLALLRTYLSPDHHKLINAYCTVGSEDALKEALQALDEEFGDEFQVGKDYKQELYQWSPVPANDPQALKSFLGFLKQCSAAMAKISSLRDLDTLTEQQKIIKKLPPHLARKWIHKTTKHHESCGEWPKLADLCSYLKYEVKVACNPLNDTDDKKGEKRNKETNSKNRSRGTSYAIESKIPGSRDKYCIKCDKHNHFTSDCGFLIRTTEEDKRKFISDNNLCFHCLTTGHGYRDCQTPVTCRVTGCEGNHATVNHNKTKKYENEKLQNTKENKQARPTTSQQEQTMESHQTQGQRRAAETSEADTARQTTPQTKNATLTCHSIRSAEETMSMFIIPVYIGYNKSSTEILTYALLDSMSDQSFISKDLVNKLDISPSDATEHSMMLHTITQQSEVKGEQIQGLRLRGYKEQYTVKLPTMITTVNDIPINKSHIPTKEAAEKWKHLRLISDKLPPPMDLNVGILLGANINAAHTPLEIITNTPEEPYAKRTVLGWSITGNHRANANQGNNCFTHRIVTKEVQDDSLHRKEICFVRDPLVPTPKEILNILESDFQPTKENAGLSMDDQLFMSILTKQTYQDETTGHITMPLPFKKKPMGLGLKTKKSAEHRFNLLLKRFEKNKEYATKYKDFMQSIIDNGDAELVDDHKDDAWYVPHFGVFHPKKPDKIRIVFDCAAKTDGKSLNDYLLAGPDMMNSLLGILMRFRQEKVALSCDIERMFHQFHVSADNRDYLRFFWLTDNEERVTYRMKVHLFGAKSSPACATFGLRYLAKTQTEHTQAQDFIRNNFYVDDGLASTEDVATATLLIQQAMQLCKKGNIRLHKFVANDSELLAHIPKTEIGDCGNVNLLNPGSTIHRTLGIQWNTSSDKFLYDLTMATKCLTRREILSTIASTFDPLGLIAPFIITGKMILQQCCKRNLGWDEKLPADLSNQWLDWLSTLEALNSIEFPRSYKPSDFKMVTKAELHSFSDASNDAYGAAIYLRLVDSEGNVSVTLIHAKARVAPSNITSIPRLELQAAVLATLLTDFVHKELTGYDIGKIYYYTDSQIVLGYLNNDTKRFQVFVANRAQKIRNYTKPSDWYYVPTKLNPADHASRGLRADKPEHNLWKQGPSFLAKQPLQLPSQPKHLTLSELQTQTEDIKKSAHAFTSMIKVEQSNQPHIFDTLYDISKWTKMVQLIATLEQYKRYLTQKHIGKLKVKTNIEAQLNAEKTIIKFLQNKHLGQDIPLEKTNIQLRKLHPFLDSDGILRVGGRLEYSHHLEYEEKHPIILPKDYITTQLVYHYHVLTGHQGRRSTLAQLRLRGYWILGGCSIISSAINKCTTCKRLRADIQGQQMAPIPEKRTEPTPPFTCVGCDIFGPFLVRDRRSTLKRYGALFTCMASKAIHIEMIDDMSTDAFLNALRCLIAIRGPVRQIHTDRGTNFIGAANELHKQIKLGKISTFASTNHIEFVTNVPYASHMGGIWERQIRSIRAVMDGLLKGHHSRLDSSSLRTLFYEIMAIINCRPLTMTEEGIPLHPNMILTLKSAVVLPPPGDFDATDVYSRKRWIQVQGMATDFWKRWRVEYLQTLQQRQKWQNQKPNLQVNDIVTMKEPDIKRNHWPLGKVEEIMPSADGLVRKVKLRLACKQDDKQNEDKTGRLLYERPVHKLVLVHRPEKK